MKSLRILIVITFVLLVSGVGKTQTSAEIDKATKAGKVVFLVVLNTPDADGLKTWNIAAEAQKKLTKKSEVIKLNTVDAVNAPLVKKYGLSGVALPMVLVLDKLGTPVGGLPLAQLNANALVKLIPTPKLSDALKALTENKSVFVVASTSSMKGSKLAIQNCNDASKNLANKNVVITIDMNDANEKDFLTKLKYNSKAIEPQTFVLNSKGQVTATYTGATKVNELIAATSKVIGGCGPGGCGPGKSCGK